jgi:hypothetical protein
MEVFSTCCDGQTQLLPLLIPFIFDVPFTVDYQIQGRVEDGFASLDFNGIQSGTSAFYLVDPNVHELLTGDFTVSADAAVFSPEPALGILVMGITTILIAVARWKRELLQ